MKKTILIAFGCDSTVLRSVANKLERLGGGQVIIISDDRRDQSLKCNDGLKIDKILLPKVIEEFAIAETPGSKYFDNPKNNYKTR